MELKFFHLLNMILLLEGGIKSCRLLFDGYAQEECASWDDKRLSRFEIAHVSDQ